MHHEELAKSLPDKTSCLDLRRRALLKASRFSAGSETDRSDDGSHKHTKCKHTKHKKRKKDQNNCIEIQIKATSLLTYCNEHNVYLYSCCFFLRNIK